MALTEDQKRRRDGKVTASFLPYLMAGDEAKILREWQRLVGDPSHVEEDLSGVWPVQFGAFIESFALDWHETKTGRKLSRHGEVVTHPYLEHVSCTLDAYRDDDATVIDCKAPGRWRKLEDVLAFYPAQLVVQRACVGAKRAALLVVHGGDEPAEHTVEWDDNYERTVWDRIAAFWDAVTSLSPPVSLPPVAAPVTAVRVSDMSGSNSWADAAATWLANRDAAKQFEGAIKSIKGMVEPDVIRAFGHGIAAIRAKNGAISIKEHTA